MTRTATVLALAACGFLAPPAAAGVTDPAAVFPADTLAYAEIARLSDFAAGLTALVAGGPLADPTPAARGRLDKLADNPAGAQRAALLALLTAPEALAEMKRFRAIGVGVVGFTSRGEPRTVAAVLLGDSHAGGLAVRAYLSAEPTVIRVATTAGVPVYQVRPVTGPTTGPDGKPLDGPVAVTAPPADAWEFTVAYAPGLVVFGSDVPAVADVLKRHASPDHGASLAGTTALRRLRDARDQSGVGFVVRPTGLLAAWDGAAKAAGGSVDPGWLALARFAVDPKAVVAVVGRLTVDRSAVTLTLDGDVAAGAASPLAALLTGPAVRPADTRFVAGQPGWTVTASVPTRDRAAVLLGLADAVAKAGGTLGRLPSEVAADADRAAGGGPTVGELLAAVRSVTAFATVWSGPAPGSRPLALVAVIESDADAEKWWHAAPTLARLVAGPEVKLGESSEVVGGVAVRTFVATGKSAWSPLHIARKGAVIAVGFDRTLVAAAVGGTGPTATISPNAAAVGVVHPVRLVPPPSPAPAKPPGNDDTLPVPALAESWAAGVAHLVRPLPPVAVTISRMDRGIRVTAALPDPAKPVAAGVTAFLDWYARQPVGPVVPRILPPGVIDR